MYLISNPTQQQLNCYVNRIAFLKKIDISDTKKKYARATRTEKSGKKGM